jgi:hypothetical protein
MNGDKGWIWKKVPLSIWRHNSVIQHKERRVLSNPAEIWNWYFLYTRQELYRYIIILGKTTEYTREQKWVILYKKGKVVPVLN